MVEPAPLSNCTIAIVGLGLMGGSMALALEGKCAQRLGIDPNPEVVEAALNAVAVEKGSCDPEELLPEADLIILAAPIAEIIRTINILPSLHPGRPVVMDLGSTKRRILAAMEALPRRFQPVGGHPMCGKEIGGFDNASKDLYRSAPFALVKLERSSAQACSLAQDTALAVGASPLWIDAATHDKWTAATSHFPYLISSVLALSTSLEARPLVGPGLRSTTRLAAAPSQMMLDILQTNADAVLNSFSHFREQLDLFETLIRLGRWEDLQLVLERTAEHQKSLLGAGSCR